MRAIVIGFVWVLATGSIRSQATPSATCGNFAGPCAGVTEGSGCALGDGQGTCQRFPGKTDEQSCFCELRLNDREYISEPLFARHEKASWTERRPSRPSADQGA